MDDAGNVTAPTKLIDTGAVEARNTGRTSRILVALAACSLILLFAGMERSMANPSLTRQVLQVEHIKIETTKKFADAVAALEKNVPQLDPAIAEALAHGDEQKATELERGQPLFIFLKRDHGALLQVCRPASQGAAIRNRQSAHRIEDDPSSFGRRPLCAVARPPLRRRKGWINFRVRQAVVLVWPV
jgi:hypothetical protein